MNCACHKFTEAVVRHGCTEIDFILLSALKVRSELAFVAGITRRILTKDMTSGEGPDFFVLFKEISDIMQCITPFTLRETVIGLCHAK